MSTDEVAFGLVHMNLGYRGRKEKGDCMHQTGAKTEGKESKKTDVLYSHKTRKEWGFALLVWDHDDKRGYQFEDGKLRVFKKDYFGLLEMSDAPSEDTAPVVAALRRRLGWREQAVPKKPKRSVESVLFEHQLALFRELYPKGFQGSKWAKEKRGIDTTRQLQRHRDMALVQARKLLCRSRMTTLIENEEYGAIIKTLIEIGNATDMIAKSKLRPLEQLHEQGVRELAENLFELFHGDAQLAIRFERFVDALVRTTGKHPSWQLATVFLSLVFPKEQFCVKTPTMRFQAACLGRQLTISAMPNAPMYERLRTMALDVEQRLMAAGYHPRDLLDIYDFMETTLSPKAMKRIEAAGERAAA